MSRRGLNLPKELSKFVEGMGGGPVLKAKDEEDAVNPSHYKGDLVMRICEYFKLGAHMMNAAKYILRAGVKLQGDETKEEAEIRDLNKAKWYIDRRIMMLRGDTRIGDLT